MRYCTKPVFILLALFIWGIGLKTNVKIMCRRVLRATKNIGCRVCCVFENALFHYRFIWNILFWKDIKTISIIEPHVWNFHMFTKTDIKTFENVLYLYLWYSFKYYVIFAKERNKNKNIYGSKFSLLFIDVCNLTPSMNWHHFIPSRNMNFRATFRARFLQFHWFNNSWKL